MFPRTLRRPLSILTLAVVLAALPPAAFGAPAGLDGLPPGSGWSSTDLLTGWWGSLVRLWGESGMSIDPNGAPAPADSGGTMDPDGSTAPGDTGVSIDPNGSAAPGDEGGSIDPNG